MNRVVVTGLGLLSPIGCEVDIAWSRLLKGHSGLSSIKAFDANEFSCKIAAELPGPEEDGGFNVSDFVATRDRRMMDDFIVYAIAAAQKAIEDSGWAAETEEDSLNTGVLIGSGIGGLKMIEKTANDYADGGPRRISPYFIPATLINLASGHVSMRHGFKGPNHSVVTACSTGAHAIGDAYRIIQKGNAKVMVAGGTEAAICKLGIGGFCSIRALSTKYNDTPEEASRPWDKGRDGFVMGEGAGVLVLEDYEHAKKRGAKIYAEVKGYGMSGDAHHITAPPEDGNGAYRSMKAAAEDAQIDPQDIGYINAHGTSTPLGDKIELRALRRFYNDQIKNTSVSSTKSAVGHLLGAAGGVEAIFSILALRDGIMPPTLNLNDPDEECADFDLVPLKAKEKELTAVLSNSFGFGGTNASLIFTKI